MSTLNVNNPLTQSISASDPISSTEQRKSVKFSSEFCSRVTQSRGEEKMNNIKGRLRSRIASDSKEMSPVATRTRTRTSCNEINLRSRKVSVIKPKCAPSERNDKFDNDINSCSSNAKEGNSNKRQSRVRKRQMGLSTSLLPKKTAASKSKSVANEKDELICNKNAKKATFFLQTEAANDTILAQAPSGSKCQKDQQEKQRQSSVGSTLLTVNIDSQTHNEGAFAFMREQLSFLKSEQFDFLYNNCKVRNIADIMNLTLNQLHAMGICEPELLQLTQMSFKMKTTSENVNVNNNGMSICKNRNKLELIKADDNLVHSNNACDNGSDSQTLLTDEKKCESFYRGTISMQNCEKLCPGISGASLTPADALRIRYEAAKHTDQIVESIKQNLQKLKTTNIDPKEKEAQLLEMYNELKQYDEQLLRRQQEMNIMELSETSYIWKKNLKKTEAEAVGGHEMTATQEEHLLIRQQQKIISESRELPGNSKLNLLEDVCNEVQVEPAFAYASVDGCVEHLEEIVEQGEGQKEQQIDMKKAGRGSSGKSKTNVIEVLRQTANDSSENSRESMRTVWKYIDEVHKLNENSLLENTEADFSTEVFAKVFREEGNRELTAIVVKYNRSSPCEKITSSDDIAEEASNSKKFDKKSTKIIEEPLVTTTIQIPHRIKLPKAEDIQQSQRLKRNDNNERAINSKINNEIVSENANAITTTMSNSGDEGKPKSKDATEAQASSNRFRKKLRIKLTRAKNLRKKQNWREDNKSGNQSVSEFSLSSDTDFTSTSLQGNSNIENALLADEQVSSTEFSKINIIKKPRSKFVQGIDIDPTSRTSHDEKVVKEDEQISSAKRPKLQVIEKHLTNLEKISNIDSSSSRMVDNLNIEDVLKKGKQVSLQILNKSVSKFAQLSDIDPVLSAKHNNLIDKRSVSKDDQENAIDSSKLRITEKKISKISPTKRSVSSPSTALYDKAKNFRKTKTSTRIRKRLTFCAAKPNTSGKLYEKVTTTDSKSRKLMLEPVVDEAAAHNNDNKERDLLATSLEYLSKPSLKDSRKRNNSISLDELHKQENELVRSVEELEIATKNPISVKEKPSCTNLIERITYERSNDLREFLKNKKDKVIMKQLTMEATNSIGVDNERRVTTSTSEQQKLEGAICQQIDSEKYQNRCYKQKTTNETKIKRVEAMSANVEQQTNDNDFVTELESNDRGNIKDEDLKYKYKTRSELCNELTEFTIKAETNIENNPTVNTMSIASPTPMDDTIASPSPPRLEEPKNYYHFNQNNGLLKSSSTQYTLYEVDIPKMAVNKPNNFDKLVKTCSLDPRVFRSPIISKQKSTPTPTSLAFPSDRRSRLPATNNFSIKHELYGQQKIYQYQQQQQNPNMLLFGYLQRSPWYQNLMSAMKIQINQSISQLVRALNNFYRERVLYPDLVFDIFKMDCAGTLIEIMQNLGIYVDAYGFISEQRLGCDMLTRCYLNPVAPANATYGFNEEISPPTRQCATVTTPSCIVPGARHNSFSDSRIETQPSSSQAHKHNEQYQSSSNRHDDANNNNRNRSHYRTDRCFHNNNQHSIESQHRRGHKRSSLSPLDLPDRSRGSKSFVATRRSSTSPSKSPSPRSYKSCKSSHTSVGQSYSNYSRKSSSQVKPQQATADDEEEECWD
ncbi:uncharacterized protein LOC119639934 isoform X1 [Glossina fuscipes]|uniref:Uncharacterized protein LOC119639934 isoform X1 n=1 Tax=Glossina fuscipes TaxID=7396 RepID=A0A9C5Z448_9MUSC|nr:uncharacterized protein LOC119639934 isoform X1 [Glossina fuscipes]